MDIFEIGKGLHMNPEEGAIIMRPLCHRSLVETVNGFNVISVCIGPH